MEPTDELFPVVKMEPKRAYEIEVSTPGRIAALEAEVKRMRAVKNGRIADLAAEVERLREALTEAEPQLATITGQLEPYRDADGWGVNVTTDDIVIWSSLSAIVDNLALALEPTP